MSQVYSSSSSSSSAAQKNNNNAKDESTLNSQPEVFDTLGMKKCLDVIPCQSFDKDDHNTKEAFQKWYDVKLINKRETNDLGRAAIKILEEEIIVHKNTATHLRDKLAKELESLNREILVASIAQKYMDIIRLIIDGCKVLVIINDEKSTPMNDCIRSLFSLTGYPRFCNVKEIEEIRTEVIEFLKKKTGSFVTFDLFSLQTQYYISRSNLKQTDKEVIVRCYGNTHRVNNSHVVWFGDLYNSDAKIGMTFSVLTLIKHAK